MLKRRKREPMGVKEPTVIRSAGHLQWVRGHECAAQNVHCSGNIEAAHTRSGTDGGTSMKPGDNWAIPLCHEHHRFQHQIGEAKFEAVFLINMKQIASELWRGSPHRLKLERR